MDSGFHSSMPWRGEVALGKGRRRQPARELRPLLEGLGSPSLEVSVRCL
jgi:hypothetical protein